MKRVTDRLAALEDEYRSLKKDCGGLKTRLQEVEGTQKLVKTESGGLETQFQEVSVGHEHDRVIPCAISCNPTYIVYVNPASVSPFSCLPLLISTKTNHIHDITGITKSARVEVSARLEPARV